MSPPFRLLQTTSATLRNGLFVVSPCLSTTPVAFTTAVQTTPHASSPNPSRLQKSTVRGPRSATYTTTATPPSSRPPIPGKPPVPAIKKAPASPDLPPAATPQLSQHFAAFSFSTSITNSGVPVWVFEDLFPPNSAAPPSCPPSPTPLVPASATGPEPEMSDEDYASFLNRASNDAAPQAHSASASGAADKGRGKGFTTQSVDADVPAALRGVDVTYTSDADEAFEAVSLKWDGHGHGKKIGVDAFRKLSGHDGVEELSVEDFDPRGEYRVVLDKVKEAGNGTVEVFRVELGGARCEYWVVSVDGESRRVVGLRAGSVES